MSGSEQILIQYWQSLLSLLWFKFIKINLFFPLDRHRYCFMQIKNAYKKCNFKIFSELLPTHVILISCNKQVHVYVINFAFMPKLYIPSTLNIDLILWHTQLIVCAENVKSWYKSWVFPFTFQAYILPHTLNCM